MGLTERTELYRKLEAHRGRPLVAYTTSTRPGLPGSIAADVVGEFSKQISALPNGAEGLDLLLISNGGDATVAWRLVSNIRERVKSLHVLVPSAAFSAATMIALGADEIVMHPLGNLGPIDSQISTPSKGRDRPKIFGSEDLTAVLELGKKIIEDAGPDLKSEMLQVFKTVCEEIEPLAIGFTQRAIGLTNMMADKMLAFHMNDASDRKSIVKQLHQSFYDHGYPISLTEAKEIGLKAVAADQTTESTLWDIWCDVETDLQLRRHFTLMSIVKDNPACAALFEPTKQVILPAGLTPDQVQEFVHNFLAGTAVKDIPATPFDLTLGMLESTRLASRWYQKGRILSERLPDLDIQLTPVLEDHGWETYLHPTTH